MADLVQGDCRHLPVLTAWIWRRLLDPFDLVSDREDGGLCTRSWMEFFEQIWVKTCSWQDVKAGDGGALRCHFLLEGIAVEKF